MNLEPNLPMPVASGMAPGRPGAKSARGPRWFIATAILLGVLAWHAVLLLAFQLRRPPTPFRTFQRTQLRILPPSGAPNSDSPAAAQAAWSPILLSLPSSFGFSASLSEAAPRTAPALDLPEEQIQFLPAPSAAADAETGSELLAARAVQDSAARQARPLNLRAHGALLPALRPPDPTAIHVTVLNGAASEWLQRAEWPAGVLEKQSLPWEAVFQTWHDEDGAVRDLFLETRTDDKDLNLALAQAAYRWELQPGAATNWVRVHLRCFGAPWPALATGADRHD